MATPEDFARQFGPLAIQKGAELGVNPEILLGQWGLESGWGKSIVPGTNNLGNIKDFSGGGVKAVDNMTGSTDAYRAYDTPQAFGNDFADLISRRYSGAIGAGSDAAKYATALKQGGYAEDPDYVRKLMGAAATARRAMGIRSDSEPNSGMVAMYQQGKMRPASMGNDDEWAMLGKQFRQSAPNAEQPKDEWDTLRQQFSQAAPEPVVAVPSQTTPEAQKTIEPKSERSTAQNLARQLGLSARAPLQAAGELAGMVGDPLNALYNKVVAAPVNAIRPGTLPELQAVSPQINPLLDKILPTPETDKEKFANRVAVGGYSAALPIPGVTALGKAAPAASATRSVASQFAANPGSQILGGSAAAGASELAAQNDVGVPGQIAAGVAGGMLGGQVGNAASRVGESVGRTTARVAKAPSASQVDEAVTSALQAQGISFGDLDSNVKNTLRTAVANAAKSGQAPDADALVRLARFESLGIKPTTAMVTRNPYAWRQEKALSKLDEVGRPLLERYRAVDQALGNELAGVAGRGIAPEALPAADAAGDAVGTAVRNAWKSTGENVDNLYGAYRSANPYANVPGQLVADTYGNIAREFGKGQIPGDVLERLQAFGFTSPDKAGRTAFTVQEADNLKRLIQNNINPANRPQTKALTMLGNSIDEAMRTGAESADTGALLSTARAAAKERFDTFKPKPLDAIVNGNVAPERWLDSQVLSKATSASDVARTMTRLDQLGVGDSVRGATAKWLMDAAFSGDPSRKAISGVAMDRAIKQVGERKLAAIYGQEGLSRLKDIAAAAKDARFDVVDSAVNRSNTGSDLANMMLSLTKIPGFSALNTGTLGLLGGALNMGARNLQDSANARAVGQAMTGSIGATPQMRAALGLNPPAPNPLLSPLLPTSIALPAAVDSRGRTPR